MTCPKCWNRNPQVTIDCDDCHERGCEKCVTRAGEKASCARCRETAVDPLWCYLCDRPTNDCACAEEELSEPECACYYTDVDVMDASGCEVHAR